MKNIFFFIISITSFVSNTQKSNIGNWFIYFGNQSINEKWNWHNEIQYRNYDFIGDTNRLLLRTGIGYNLSENNNNLLLGYGFINTQKYIGNTNDKASINEHRTSQQFITNKILSDYFYNIVIELNNVFCKMIFKDVLRIF